MSLPAPPRFERNLLNAERGTRILGGKNYHWMRVHKHNFELGRGGWELHLVPGVDPDKVGTCQHVATFMGYGTQECVLDWPHTYRDHRTKDGMHFPNAERVKILNPNGSGQELVMTDQMAQALEKRVAEMVEEA